MWAVAAQPRTGLTPRMPTPSVDSGIARARLISKLLLRAVDERAPYQGSRSREGSGRRPRGRVGTGPRASTGSAGGPRIRGRWAQHRAKPGVPDQDDLI